MNWIKIEDELPNEDEPVLIGLACSRNPKGFLVEVGRREGSFFETWNDRGWISIEDVIGWLPTDKVEQVFQSNSLSE